MINNLNLQEMLNEATKVGFHFVKCLIWDKQSKICGTYYMNQFEYICLFRKGGDRPINNCGTSDILSIPIKKLKDENGNNLHDTEKPIELMKILVENSTNEGETVIDPFMGIGSCGIASKMLNRNFIGCEIDPKYFEIAKNRIENNGNYVDNSKENLFPEDKIKLANLEKAMQIILKENIDKLPIFKNGNVLKALKQILTVAES